MNGQIQYSLGYGGISAFVNAWAPGRFILQAFVVLAFLASGVVPAAAATSTVKHQLVVLGDSLSAGLGLERRDAFPARLEKALKWQGYRVTIANAGVSGDTTAGGKARLDWTLSGIDGGVDGVILALGANDGLRGLDPKQSQQNLDAIIGDLKKRGIAVLLLGMVAPPNLGADYGKAFNAIYPSLAKKHGLILYPFFLDGVAAVPHLNQADGIHPNSAGVKELVLRLLPVVRNFINEKIKGR